MTDIILKIAGSAFGVPMNVDMQVAGGPFSFSLKTEQSISINDIWDLFSEQLASVTGVALPTIPPGPWQKIMDVRIFPSLWITPDGGTGNTSAFLLLTLEEELSLGVNYHAAGFDITIEPNIIITGLVIGYDGAGDGLTVKARIKTPVSSGNSRSLNASPANSKEQLVNFPFPLPAQNSVSSFKLNYLGIGQRVGPTPQVPGSGNPMDLIFNQLETQLTGNDPETIITRLAHDFYQPDRDWFIAADVELRELRLRVLFNDPAMYGLEVSIPMTSPPSFFSGLLFEILYQKLGPNLGVYYGALTLPYGMRRIPLEGFILILPGFSAWIYTNGDFRINVGWPVTPDNAIGISFDILTGWAGFYFAKLRSGDNPGALPSVNYNPILEFGIGVAVTAGISISAGPLSASLAVSLSASFQGLLAWEASGSSIANPPDHYWFAGSASISVLLQGSVDLAIIKASVMVSFSVSAGVAFETGYQTVIPISASVSVSVSLKVVFFTIHLSFHTTVNHTFYIGDGTPASLNGPLAPGLNVMSSAPQAWQKIVTSAREYATLQRTQLADALRPLHDVHEPLRFRASSARQPGINRLQSALTTLDVVFVLQPTVVWDNQQQPCVNLIASLVMECPAPNAPALASPDAATGYEVVIIKLLKWLMTFIPEPHIDQPLSVTLQALSARLGSGSAEPGPAFGGKDGFRTLLEAFFASTLCFTLRGVSSGEIPFATAAVLPMFDYLRMETGADSVDFSRFNPTPANYASALNIYFDNVGLVGSERTEQVNSSILQAEVSPPEGPAMASYLFADYFLMIARYALETLIQDAQQYEKQQETQLRRRAKQAAANHIDANNPLAFLAAIGPELLTANPTQELNTLLDNLAYWSIAGFGSRYLMSGLQLPDPAQVPPQVTPQNITAIPTSALYLLSGQQYAVSGSPPDAAATLRFTPGLEVDWIQFAAASPGSASAGFDIPAALPENPDPQWIFHTTSASPAPLTADTLLVNPLPAALSAPLGYQLKNSLAWRNVQDARTLYIFPQPLLNRLQALLTQPPEQAHLQLSLEGSEQDQDIANSPIGAVATLQIRLSLTQVSTAALHRDGSPASPQPKVQPNIYQLNGTDEATRELIYQALQGDLSGATLRLLYLPQGSTEWVSDDLDPLVLLAKLNLSTLNQVEQVSRMHSMMLAALPADSDAALVSDAQRFLRLVWELSVVRAPGYYLHYRSRDGQGLPDTLFADTASSNGSPDDPTQKTVQGSHAGTADLMIIVEFGDQPASQLTLSPCHNSLWIDADSQIAALIGQLYDASGEPLYAWQSAYAAGNIGFAASWTPASAPSPAPSIAVSHLYHLMQYRIVADGTEYRDSVWSLPVGPTESSAASSPDALWQLQQLVPLVPFCSAGSNPYAVIGHPATLSFRLCDMYGNPLASTHNDSFIPLYSDPLIALGEWPGLKSTYAFLADSAASPDKALLLVELEFSPNIVEPLTSPGNDTRAQWISMRDKFQRIIDQLNDAHCHFSLSCSLINGPLPDDPTPDLLAFATLILGEINQHILGSHSALIGAPDTVLKQPLLFDLPYALLTQQVHDIVDIGVSLNTRRDSNLVDSEVVEKIPQVGQVSYPLLARLALTDSAGSPASPQSDDLSLNAFALNFEHAFSCFDGKDGCLKLAQRAGEQIGSGSSQQQDLWAVRFSASQGFSVTFAPEPLYFALRPLNIIPRSGMVDNRQYNDVDMDAWASSFFSAFDTFLSPQMGVAVALLDQQNQTNYYDLLMQSKQKLAKAIPYGLVPVLQKDADSGEGDSAAAQQRLQQALLENLSSAYTVSTIVQLPVSVNVQGIADDTSPQQAPQLYGSLQQPPQGSPPGENSSNLYQFTPVTLDLAGGTQWATSLLTVAKPGDQSSITLPLEYQASYLQHDFTPDQSQDGYVPSSWLKFVLPDSEPLVMPVTATGSPSDRATIPIPLPFEPPLPMLVSQQALGVEMTSPSSSPGSLADEIAQALQWRYRVQVSLDLKDQDQFYFDFTRNVLANQAMLLNDHQQNAHLLDELFTALARFTYDWPELSLQLGSIEQQAYTNQPGGASAVVGQFYTLVNNVASSWPINWNRRMLLAATLYEIDHFCLSFSGNILQLRGQTEQGEQNPAFWPSILLGDNSQWTPDRNTARLQDGWWYITCKIKQAPLFTSTTFTWEPLAILDYQSAQFSAWTVRNAELVPQLATNPLFVYQTDSIRFPAPMIPLIERDSLPEVQVPAISLSVLQQILQEIMTPLTAVNEPGINPTINLQVSHAWGLVPGADLLVESPVLLINALQLDNASPTTLADEVAEEIWQWYLANNPPVLQSQMQFAFTLFGSVNGQQLPLVQINRIPVLFSHLQGDV
ncbi:hypothetical protein [Erwinia sorbitola]|uniref:Uncharacterized protein n=1 Tax=Erwinia sorbitola TaxID=2681984 RepID=A0A6I6EV83_9GAMM|nr:hypothetical protein [Erwinia sorbitola]QGU88492.1 hypothetical protein GN242_15265 [Erwinia sorbitola]